MMKKFLTLKEASEYMGVEDFEMERIIAENRLPLYKIGGVYTRVRVDDLNAFMRCSPRREKQAKNKSSFADRIKDFFYFNDFYILSFLAITAILYLILR